MSEIQYTRALDERDLIIIYERMQTMQDHINKLEIKIVNLEAHINSTSATIGQTISMHKAFNEVRAEALNPAKLIPESISKNGIAWDINNRQDEQPLYSSKPTDSPEDL